MRHMILWRKLLIVITGGIILCSSSGCLAGTILTRGDRAVVGGYPFQAVAVDVEMVAKAGDPPVDTSGVMIGGGTFLFWGLISLPLDLAIDLVATPLDLGFWAFDVHKTKP